jgi:hypothetical protein
MTITSDNTSDSTSDDTGTTSGSPRGRLLALGAGVLAVVVVVAAVVLWRSRGSDVEVPYDDPQAAGLITLCSADGEPVTGGKVTDRPFAAVVLGATGLPADAEPQGAVATLFGYQPRAGIAAGEFSGAPITAAGVLVDPRHPAVAVTGDAWSVGDFVAAFPAAWDGFVQLRLYLGTARDGTLTESPYDTADLRVDGSSWELVDGGHASCAGASSLVP